MALLLRGERRDFCHPGRYSQRSQRTWREGYCHSLLPPHETTRTLQAPPPPRGDRYLNRTLGLPPLRGGAEVATRNAADFAGCELEVTNPWL